MDLNFLDLCGIMAILNIFNAFGGSFLMSSYRITLACPSTSFSATSAWSLKSQWYHGDSPNTRKVVLTSTIMGLYPAGTAAMQR